MGALDVEVGQVPDRLGDGRRAGAQARGVPLHVLGGAAVVEAMYTIGWPARRRAPPTRGPAPVDAEDGRDGVGRSGRSARTPPRRRWPGSPGTSDAAMEVRPEG